ncbi:MAG: lytic transglycosylase domain-containing protein [Kiloniellales bacterium]
MFRWLRLPLLGAVVVAVLLAAGGPGSRASERLSDSDREHYRNAFLHFGKKRYRDAHLHATRASNALPAKVIQWLLLTEAEDQASFDEARAFYQQNPDWPRLRSLQRTIERRMPANLPDKQILAWFETNPPITAEGAMLQIGALLRAGRNDEAKRLISATWRGTSFDVRQEEQFHRLYRELLTHEDHVARLDRLLWDRSGSSALRQARRAGKGYPELAGARLALAARKPGVDNEIARVPKALRDDPGLNYERALWRKGKGRYEGVVELLVPLPGSLPNPERWAGLRLWAAREALAHKDYKTAYRIASNHGLTEGADFAEAEWLSGWTAFSFLKQPDKAYQHFAKLYYGSTGTISQSRGAYWSGEAAAAMGETDAALRWYQVAAEHDTTFYGQLATSRRGLPVSINAPQPRPAGEADRARFDKWDLVRIVRLLGQLRERDLQQTFLYHLRDLAVSEADYQLAAALAIEVGRPDVALSVAKQARNEGIWLLEELFPMTGLPAHTEPEHALVLAVIRQESAFDGGAISHAGARGLMQIMPATAKRLAQQLRMSYSQDKLVNDPAFNLKLGRTYLSQLLKRFDGSAALALAAYNAGPGRVQSWIRQNGDPRDQKVDPVQWIEQIPFSETRNYVMRVLESLVVYRHRLNSQLVELPLTPTTQ